MRQWLRRLDERNQHQLEEDARWLSGDDWAARSAELRQRRRMRTAITSTGSFAAVAGVGLGARFAALSHDWRWGVAAGGLGSSILVLLWRRGGRWRERYGPEVERIESGPP